MKTLKYNLTALSSSLICLSLLAFAGESNASTYVYQGSPSVHRAPASASAYKSSPSVHASVKGKSNVNTYVYQGSPAVHRAVQQKAYTLNTNEMLASK
jgi:hypothetical protein